MLTTKQDELYNNLMSLTQEGDTFYFQDFNLQGSTYRIFNYRLCSYSDFLKLDAIECRGIMYEVHTPKRADPPCTAPPTGWWCTREAGHEGPCAARQDNDTASFAVRLASRPMPKFFNIDENPLTMNLDLSKVDTIEDKADGSLMSTYTHESKLRLKSKGSLFSEQAIDAMNWLEQQPNLFKMLQALDELGWTINMEWCAPYNRIVLGYPVAHLKILNARSRLLGHYLDRKKLVDLLGEDNVIAQVDTAGLDTTAFIQSIPAMQEDIEGYVARIGDVWFKIKSTKYISLHHAKDSINNPRRLFEAIIDEGIDDLRSMFATDAPAIQTIDTMEKTVQTLYNGMVATVESFYTSNKELDRKDYAIKGRNTAELDQRFFGLVMNMYQEKPVEYKAFLKSKYKEFGIRDTVSERANAVQ